MLEKINPIQAIGSLIAIVLYLVAPVMSLMLIGYGVNGQLLMKLDGYFVVPLVLMIVTLIVSLLPVGKLTSVAGIITAVANLILGLCGTGVIASNVDALCTLMGIDLGSYGAAASMALNSMLRMGWGMIAGVVILAVAAVAGLLIGNQSGSGYNRGSGMSSGGRSSVPSYSGGANTGHRATRNMNSSNLYRR